MAEPTPSNLNDVRTSSAPVAGDVQMTPHIGPGFARTQQTQLGVTALASELLPRIGTVGTNVSLMADLNNGVFAFYLQNQLSDDFRFNFTELARIPYDDFVDPEKRQAVIERIEKNSRWNIMRSDVYTGQQKDFVHYDGYLQFNQNNLAQARTSIGVMQNSPAEYLAALRQEVQHHVSQGLTFEPGQKLHVVISEYGEDRLMTDAQIAKLKADYRSLTVLGSLDANQLASSDPAIQTELVKQFKKDVAFSNAAYHLGHDGYQAIDVQLHAEIESAQEYIKKDALEAGLTPELARTQRQKTARVLAEYASQLPDWMQTHLTNVNLYTLSEKADFNFLAEKRFSAGGGKEFHLGIYEKDRHTVEAHINATSLQMGAESSIMGVLIHEVGHSMHPLGLNTDSVSWLEGYETKHRERWNAAAMKYINSPLSNDLPHAHTIRKLYEEQNYGGEMFAELTRDYNETYVRTGGDEAAINKHMGKRYGELWDIYHDDVIPEMKHQAEMLRTKHKAQAPQRPNNAETSHAVNETGDAQIPPRQSGQGATDTHAPESNEYRIRQESRPHTPVPEMGNTIRATHISAAGVGLGMGGVGLWDKFTNEQSGYSQDMASGDKTRRGLAVTSATMDGADVVAGSVEALAVMRGAASSSFITKVVGRAAIPLAIVSGAADTGAAIAAKDGHRAAHAIGGTAGGVLGGLGGGIAGGILGGMVTGALAGSVVPGFGTVVGGAVGLACGIGGALLGGWAASEAADYAVGNQLDAALKGSNSPQLATVASKPEVPTRIHASAHVREPAAEPAQQTDMQKLVSPEILGQLRVAMNGQGSSAYAKTQQSQHQIG